MDDILIAKGFALLLMPPLVNLLLLVTGLYLKRKYHKMGTLLISLSLLSLFALSLPIVAWYLLSLSENIQPLPVEGSLKGQGDAIVILGAGRRIQAIEYGGDTASYKALERLRYGMHLYKRTGLPILVTGGSVYGENISEANIMQDILQNEYYIPVKWIENDSRNTMENASMTGKILLAENIRKIFLVTHALHMPRATIAFEQQGFEVVPAPTAFLHSPLTDFNVTDILPSAQALEKNNRVIHEWLGRIWYSIRY